MTIPEGTRLRRYEIGELLGAGGMGEVYLANDLTLHRKVAVKVLRADVVGNKDRLRRFELEALSASSLNHPNILTIYELGHEDEYHFMVTEFIDGESLGQRLQGESLPLPDALAISIQVASALAAAHQAGIIHRDIKPDNIMLRRDRLVKVLDFGLAKLSESGNDAFDTRMMSTAPQLTVPGVVMGTPRYMSPEQTCGDAVDARTDIWSLGIVLYQMLTGHLPFTGRTMSDVMAAVLTAEPPALTSYVPDLPEELDGIVARALKKDREERYRSVKDLAADLDAVLQRLKFDAEVERISGKQKAYGSGQDSGSRRSNAERTTLVKGSVAKEQSALQSPNSSAEYLIGTIGQHRHVLLLLGAFVTLALAATYFGYLHFSKVSDRMGISSLAVLPFTNTGNDPEKEYLSDGISESLINQLSQLAGVKVIANSSSSRYKSGDADPREVARALDVGAVLTGKILQRGDSLLISVELIDGRDRTQLWGDQYNRKSTDLLAVQLEIAREIAQALRLRLTAGQRQKLVTSSVVKPEAYELLLKGRFHSARGTIEDRKQASEYFNQAIAIDPGYALAYACLSDIYRSLVTSSTLDPKVYLSKAQDAALKSLELDEGLAEGHYCLANLKTYDWKWADAETEYKRAIELNSNLALAHRWYASYLRLVGRNDQAIAEIKLARDLDPLSPGVNATVGYVFFGARQYDQAIAVLKKTLQSDPTYPYAHLFLGFTYAEKGMYADAIAAYQEAIKLGLDTPSTQIHLGVTCWRAGNREQALAILKRFQASSEHVSPTELAMLYTTIGERKQAFESLEEAFKAHDFQLQYLGVSPEFDILRAEPQFKSLLLRVGLTP